MWQRFTERARRIVFLACEEARRTGHFEVAPEHILLGLTQEEDGAAAFVLDRMNVPMAQIRREIERQALPGERRLGVKVQLAPAGRHVIDLAYEEARALSNNYIGSEHLLLGLIGGADGLAGRVLSSLGIDRERARREILDLQDRRSKIGPFGKRVAMEFAKLPVDQQQALSEAGLGFGDLPENLQEAVQGLLDAGINGEPRVRLDLTAASIRFVTEQIGGITQNTVIAEAALSVAFTSDRLP